MESIILALLTGGGAVRADKLVAAGIIDSPDRWKSGEWSTRAVELLIIKMAG